MAIVSIAAGVASWTIAPVVASIVAIVCGHMARTQIRQTGEDGDQFAVIGLVLGYVHIVAACLVMAFVAVMYAGIFAFIATGAAQR